jgi:hypothetical protein
VTITKFEELQPMEKDERLEHQNEKDEVKLASLRMFGFCSSFNLSSLPYRASV